MDAPRAPVVFKHRELKPDTRLQVFETAFHVHSSVLKANSAFFAKFMDSPEKDNRVASLSGFRYEWVTNVDGDGSWSLQSSKSNTNVIVQEYMGDSEHEASVFEKFLSALYFTSYSIKNVEELEMLTEKGDYYRALPVISQSLYRSFLRNHEFVDSIPSDALQILPVAAKLRNPDLFRECMIHVLGPWHEPQYLKLEDPVLVRIAREIHSGFREKLQAIDEDIMLSMGSDHLYGAEIRDAMYSAACKACCYTTRFRKPCYYASLYKYACDKAIPWIKTLLSPICVGNRLIFGSETWLGGEGDYVESFLCFDIPDDKLPWDTEETDF